MQPIETSRTFIENSTQDLEDFLQRVNFVGSQFLEKVRKLVERKTKDQPLKKKEDGDGIWLVFHEEAEKNLSPVIELIEIHLKQISLEEVRRISLDKNTCTTEFLSPTDEKFRLIILFATEEFGEKGAWKEVKDQLKTFVEKKGVDSLHVLLCSNIQGSFNRIALNLVEKNQMVRSVGTMVVGMKVNFEHPQNEDPHIEDCEKQWEAEHEAILQYWDTFWALRGTQGLGLMPDLIDLANNKINKKRRG
eukprot:TRINITY_DN134_c1_g1_i4.p1 TRINITY_DN134_c1_g1~~TRINITY_DN134_c1_g1_i4.p1  ORF type:complete len:248 (-),score=69.16 TRINITY_DN134_c1_g1_i4:264-1007(-)